MKKKYNLPREEDGFEKNMVNEPMAPAYGMETEMEVLPALTDEELKNLLTEEELLDRVLPRIKKFFE